MDEQRDKQGIVDEQDTVVDEASKGDEECTMQGDKQGTVDEHDTVVNEASKGDEECAVDEQDIVVDEQASKGDEERATDEQWDKQGTVNEASKGNEEGAPNEQDTVVNEQASKGDEDRTMDEQGDNQGIVDEQDTNGDEEGTVDEQASKGDEEATVDEQGTNGDDAPIMVAPLRAIVPPLAVKSRLVVLDMNGLLLKRYKINYYRGLPRGFPILAEGHVFKVITPPRVQRKQHFQYVVRPDASTFLRGLNQQFSLTIWSSCTKQNLTATLSACFYDIEDKVTTGLRGQELCRTYSCGLQDIPGIPKSSYNEKPIFLKVLDDLWELHPPDFNADSTILIDDIEYKCMYNPKGCCIFSPSFDPEDTEQDPYYLTRTLFPWLVKWRLSEQPRQYVQQNMIVNHMDTVSAFVLRHHKNHSSTR